MGEVVATTIEEKYPEHQKILERSAEHQHVQAFIDYLRGEAGVEGLVFDNHLEETSRDGRVHFTSFTDAEARTLIAGFFEIDERAFEEEKRTMLLELRRHH